MSLSIALAFGSKLSKCKAVNLSKMVFLPINRWINNETFTSEISVDVIDSNSADKIKMQVYPLKITIKSIDLK